MVAKVAKTGGARLLRPWRGQRQSRRSTLAIPEQITPAWSDKTALSESKNYIDQLIGNHYNLLHRLTIEFGFDLFVGKG